jgi:hypothetical protein
VGEGRWQDADHWSMKRADSERVNQWKQSGAVAVWRYLEGERNFPGWHLACNRDGHRSLLDLLERLREASSGDPVDRSVRLTPPSVRVLAVPNNRRAGVFAPDRLRLQTAPGAEIWTWEDIGSDLRLTAGTHGLDGLITWLAKPAQAFDTSFGRSPPLWFWGNVDELVAG